MLGVEASDEPRRSEWTIAPIYMSQSHVRPARANEAKGRLVELIELVEGTHRVQDLAERNGRRGQRERGEWERGRETNEAPFAYSLKSARIARRGIEPLGSGRG